MGYATLGLLTPLHTCKHPIKALRTAGDEYLWDESYSEQLMILPCMRIVYEVTEMVGIYSSVIVLFSPPWALICSRTMVRCVAAYVAS